MELTASTILYVPSLSVLPDADWTVFVDGDRPNWCSADAKGAWLLEQLAEGPEPFPVLVAAYGRRFGLDAGKALFHVHAFVQEAMRHGIIQTSPVQPFIYRGRGHYLHLSHLREFWIHSNNSCNLSCSHCLVSSSPQGEKGLPTATWKDLVDQAAALGVERFYITGGEPFVRADMPELIRHITERHRTEVVVLSNATLFATARRSMLDGLSTERVRFQVSVDGSNPAINDPIRGAGSFDATVSGMKELRRRGFDVTLTTVAMGSNLEDLPKITRVAESCGVRSQHLMWIHRRGRVAAAPRHPLGGEEGAASAGRIAEASNDWFPSTERLIEAVRKVKQETDACGIILDNAASFELRANAPAGIKFDLGNAGWQSICVYADGHVYPSAAMANHGPMDCGDVTNGTRLDSIWKEHPILKKIREASVIHKAQAAGDALRYLTGGGDLEHSYFFSGDFLGEDPYYPLYQAMLRDAMHTLTARKAALVNTRSGYDAPRILHAMGDGAVVCGTTEIGAEDVEVAFLHSNCVLSFDVEKPRNIVKEFYGQAAEKPQAELCCPTKYDEKEVSHIPQEVLERFYGCGSPVNSANPQPGEVYVDLGSGAGIDCFIAAKRVGSAGKVIGVDMTDPMLEVARASNARVAQNLGFSNVEFRKGYLEDVPVDSKFADVVTSNCVMNLSPDKPKVFAELWRVLKNHGRMVIADIVSDREVPPRLKVNEKLWGECIVGALTESQFLAMLEQAGFYGLSVLKKAFWKEIEGYQFYSVTVQGWKFEKTEGCKFIGQQAIYKGPFTAILDEEGHHFPRNVAITVCTDTAAKLSRAPYAGQFTILEPSGEVRQIAEACCVTEEAEGGCC